MKMVCLLALALPIEAGVPFAQGLRNVVVEILACGPASEQTSSLDWVQSSVSSEDSAFDFAAPGLKGPSAPRSGHE